MHNHAIRLAHIAALLVIAVGITAAVPAFALPEPSAPQEFTAMMDTSTPDGKSTLKVYFSRNKARVETVGVAEDGTGVIIVRYDIKAAWVLLPSEKRYKKFSIDKQETNPLLYKPKNVISREKLGEEGVDGFHTVKEKLTVKNKSGSTESFYLWTAPEVEWPMKAEAVDGKWSYSFKDFQAGAQDLGMFLIPMEYTKVAGAKRANNTPVSGEAKNTQDRDVVELYVSDGFTIQRKDMDAINNILKLLMFVN